jgi:proteasome lid subunit RPN8/RPN11
VVNLVSSCSCVKISEIADTGIECAVERAGDIEACGFLLGEVVGRCVLIKKSREAVNIYQSRTKFAISPAEYMVVLGEQTPKEYVVGVFHIHFGPVTLSATDEYQLRMHQLLWMIADGSKPSEDWKENLGLFKYDQGMIRAMTLDREAR